jgi:iron complex outermembrane recepter protein
MASSGSIVIDSIGKSFLSLLCLIILAIQPAVADESEDLLDELLEISFDELTQVEIVSASKKAETVFNSPLSASVLTRTEIQNAGCTSIMEALRLMPGMIVREQTNGNYDIHIRGFGNVPANSMISSATNSISLVMVDGRYAYNYLNGGTFWESLAIDLCDVERIELIRGPSTALYGPNAVSGVINIITRKPEADGFYSVANVQAGNYGTAIGNGSIGFKSESTAFILSGNYQQRDRSQTAYYQSDLERYVDYPDTVTMLMTGQKWSNFKDRYPDPSNAMDKYGVNSFIEIAPDENLSIALRAGYQEATVQNIFSDVGDLIVKTYEYETFHADIDIKYRNLYASIESVSGDRAQLGVPNNSSIPHSALDYYLEYDHEAGNLTVRPGLNLKHVDYDWSLMGGKQHIKSFGYFLRSDYDADQYRIISALRGDKYRHPDETYLSYQFGAMYKFDSNNLLRAVYSRANRAPFMASLYFDMEIEVPIPQVPDIANYGNTDLKLMTMDMAELGYRSVCSKAVQIDAELFFAETRDYSDMYANGDFYEGAGGKLSPINQHQNLDVKAQQIGGTISVNYMPKSNLLIKPFITWQSTELYDYAPDLYENPDSLIDASHTHDPEFYGGLVVNYSPIPKVNANLNLYFYTEQTHDYRDITVAIPYPPPGTSRKYVRNVDIKGKVLFNGKVAYEVGRDVKLFISGRNITGAEAYEFAYGDKAATIFTGGIQFGN